MTAGRQCKVLSPRVLALLQDRCRAISLGSVVWQQTRRMLVDRTGMLRRVGTNANAVSGRSGLGDCSDAIGKTRRTGPAPLVSCDGENAGSTGRWREGRKPHQAMASSRSACPGTGGLYIRRGRIRNLQTPDLAGRRTTEHQTVERPTRPGDARLLLIPSLSAPPVPYLSRPSGTDRAGTHSRDGSSRPQPCGMCIGIASVSGLVVRYMGDAACPATESAMEEWGGDRPPLSNAQTDGVHD
ncbi:uncharacterized protein BJ171DRAFT_53864 [Polychytrium aggregatum]|uniref:uncharacterized protein n=1 Tax=Polychytrium aggregatum TaxID=110093 RepID=UPI0022FE3658|nr:uncharacterized protein BJ171DRAFT_53864 [Polychytrium aggregatum]KAI9205840.1 hypothetical protein BJ171DRAFT_53864 [Polychytrium aggregatum]